MKVDFGHISILLVFAGTFVIAYSIIFQGFEHIRNETATYIGSNPYAFKSAINVKYQGTVGIILIIIGLISYLIQYCYNPNICFFRFVKMPMLSLVSSLMSVLIVVLLSVFLANAIAKRHWYPKLKEDMKRTIESYTYSLLNNGAQLPRSEWVKPIEGEQREKRISEAKIFISRTEMLFEINSEGSWEERANRLRKVIETE